MENNLDQANIWLQRYIGASNRLFNKQKQVINNQKNYQHNLDDRLGYQPGKLPREFERDFATADLYAMRNNYALGKRLASEIKSLQTELKKIAKGYRYSCLLNKKKYAQNPAKKFLERQIKNCESDYWRFMDGDKKGMSDTFQRTLLAAIMIGGGVGAGIPASLGLGLGPVMLLAAASAVGSVIVGSIVYAVVDAVRHGIPERDFNQMKQDAGLNAKDPNSMISNYLSHLTEVDQSFAAELQTYSGKVLSQEGRPASGGSSHSLSDPHAEGPSIGSDPGKPMRRAPESPAPPGPSP